MNKNKLLLFALLLLVSQAQYTYVQDAGCATFDANSKCITCKDRYYMYPILSICLPVSPLCKDYSPADGSCLSCVTGFALTQGQCQPSVILVPVSKNQANCATFNSVSQLCQICNSGYTVLNGACIQSIPYCDLYTADAKCSKCASGYALNGSTCAKIVVAVPIDVNCKISDSVKCVACKDGYFLTSQAACIKTSPICAKYDANGICVECEPTFTLSSGKCYSQDALSVKTTTYDPLCNRFEKGVCLKCSYGAYFDAQGICRLSNPLCKESDTTGACTVCYSGFELKNGSCVLVIQDLDPNCNQFEGAKCIRCSFGAFFDVNGKCVVTDPNCKRWNNGACEGCYPGYVMNNQSKCIFDPDFNCADFSNGQCNRCSTGYYLDNGRCKLINTLCAKFDFLLKKCTNCYIGYALYQGQCTDYSKLTDLTGYNINCKQYDDTGKCIACFDRYFLQYGTCVEVSPYCKTFNPIKGYCLSCYDGYHIDEFGQCIVNN